MSDKPTYEKADFNIQAIGTFTIGLTLVILLTVFVSWVIWKAWSDRYSPIGAAGTRPIEQQADLPEPRLQPVPRIEFQKYYTEQTRHLNSYGWVDTTKGIVHIPIDIAIQQVAEAGLPARAATRQP